ncbi:MAG: metal ABC transporter ATP-binding protein [Patescibacteria group bacterium]|nr:metal ABC transporter ATP-binding protein [Patescibacteria group bacterium]
MSSPQTKTNSAITVKNLSVRLGGKEILTNISFEIEKGIIAAVIGPNGSGKTTLLRAILDLISLSSGTVKILDQPLHHVRQAIGYVPQKFSFDPNFPMNVREFLRMAQHKEASKDKIEESLRYVELPQGIEKQAIGSLSGGQLQRVLIAQAIINDPAILILDEPATGIDIAGELAFVKIIKRLNEENGTTIILVSHDVSMVSKMVNQVICINHTLTCMGPPEKALDKKTLEDIFGSHTHLVHHNTEKHK